MNATPLLQIAMDYISLPKALAMAVLVAPEVDIIEIGTPLCKAAGLDAIRSMREICPDKLILADFKTPDVGGLEATMAFDAGADMLTVIGGAALATVEQALAVARQRGKEMLMELTGVRDNEILVRAAEWRKIGVERLVYHREWDAQSAGRMWAESDKVTIRKLIDMGFKLTVTGGMTMELLPFFADLPVSVLICGRGIREAARPSRRCSRNAPGSGRIMVWSIPQCSSIIVLRSLIGLIHRRSFGQSHSLGCERNGFVAGCGWARLPRLRLSPAVFVWALKQIFSAQAICVPRMLCAAWGRL